VALKITGLLFDYWHDYKAGKLDRATFRAWMAPVRAQIEAMLERAVASDIDDLAGLCANILEHRVALWSNATPERLQSMSVLLGPESLCS